jgi:small subunit ribosomal protein S17
MISSEGTISKGRTMQGVVVSNKGDKTIVVRVTRRVKDPVYGKIVTKSAKFHAHDEKNLCSIGDEVLIRESRPLSKLKHWTLVELLEKEGVR